MYICCILCSRLFVDNLKLAEGSEGVLDLLCQKLADQALHFKDLVKEAIEPGVGMAKAGAEFSDELTPTSENGSSDYSSSTDQDHDSDSTQGPSSGSQDDVFPIMQLPVEVSSS